MEISIMELAAAFFGPLGLCILFYLRRQLLFPAAFGGLFNRMIFLAALGGTDNMTAAYLVSSAAAAVYAEILARWLKVPATVILFPAISTSVPGRLLFYTMSSMAWGRLDEMKKYALMTGKYALTIALGISLAGACFSITNKMREEYDRKRNTQF